MVMGKMVSWRDGKVLGFCLVASLMLSASANAQTCATLVNDMKNWSQGGGAVLVRFTTTQKNKISTSNNGGYMRWDNTNQHMTTAYPGVEAFMQFNDRNNATWTAQNFSLASSQTEGDDFDIFINGSGVAQASMTNLVWGNSLTVASLTCSNGIMFGFGSRIGNDPNVPASGAMYAFTIHLL